MTASLQNLAESLAEFDTQKSVLEREMFTLMLPIYRDIVARLGESDVENLVADCAVFQARFVQDSIQWQQVGYIMQVLGAVNSFFTSGITSLEDLTAPVVPLMDGFGVS